VSKLSELSYDIQELYIEGHSAKMIAVMLECSIEDVLVCLQEMNVADSQHTEDVDYDQVSF
jgi:hypothetical protein